LIKEMASYDVIFIGGGPAGYVGAIRCAQLGMSVAVVEREGLGGTCVLWGCIPAKALLEAASLATRVSHSADFGVTVAEVKLDYGVAMKRSRAVSIQNSKGVEFLFKKNKITWAKGRGTLKKENVVEVAGTDGKTESYRAKNVIIATGSVPVELPFLKFDEKRVLSNIGALTIPAVPRHLLVIGGGVIGLELGSVWRRLGAKVTVVELMPTILPGNDEEIIKEADKVFRKQGLDIRVGSKVTGAKVDANRVIVDVEKDGKSEKIEADYVLVSVGRKSAMTGIDAAALGLGVSKRGEILVDSQMRTNLPNVFAIGDVVGGKLLAHKAEDEGVVAVEAIAGQRSHIDYKSMPSVVYTWPEIATVGLAEHEVKASGRQYKTGRFPFSANARARTAGDTTGFVKFIADAETDELLGAHMIGPGVSELIQEAVLAFEYRGSSEDIGITVHSHPTLSEAVKEAALGVLGRSLQI